MSALFNTVSDIDTLDTSSLTLDCDEKGSIAIFKIGDETHSRNGKEIRFNSFDTLIEAIKRVGGDKFMTDIIDNMKKSTEDIRYYIKGLGGIDGVLSKIRSSGKVIPETDAYSDVYELIDIVIPQLRYSYRDYMLYMIKDADIVNEAKAQSVYREPSYMNMRLQGYAWIEDCEESEICFAKNLSSSEINEYDRMIEKSSGWEIPISLYNMNTNRNDDNNIEKQYRLMFKSIDNIMNLADSL